MAAEPYPAILAMAGLSDPQETYWAPVKWVLRLRDHSTSGNPVRFKVNMDTAHGSTSWRFARLVETALIQAFVLRAVGEG